MNKQPGSEKQSPKKQPEAHPIHSETKKKTERLPGNESSAASFPGQPDARTNVDKDGNAAHVEKNTRERSRLKR
jgi:hypothetical protein